MKQKITFTLSVAVLLFVFSCKTEQSESFEVRQGDFTQTITETGELAAVNVRAFVMQRFGRYWYTMKIIGLLEHGTAVQAGDSIIQFDPSPVQRFIIERETNLETQEANLEKMLVEIRNRKSELFSALRSEEASFALKKLELEQFRFESERAKKIKELEFQQAEIRLDKAKKSIDFYNVVAENQLHIQQIHVNRIREEINNAYQILPQLTLRTPIPGIFQVARKRRSRDLIMIGDEVFVGNSLGNVPDLTWTKVNTVVNETDFMKVYKGQAVNVRLDALPDVVFEGEVVKISRLCRPIERDSRLKVFDVEVRIRESDQRLKPGMTVGCEYICADLSDVLYAPLSCVEKIDNRHYVYLPAGKGYQRKEVRTGPANSRSIVIESDLQRGQKLLPVSEIEKINNE